MSNWSNDNDEHRRDNSELEAIYDAKREVHEFEDEKRRVYIGEDKATFDLYVFDEWDWGDNDAADPEQADREEN